MIKKQLFVILITVISITSCTTYLIPINSFKQQFTGIDSTKLIEVKVLGPIGEIYNYQANPIGIIKCVDKQGNPIGLINSPSIEIRITHGAKNKKTVFYFDRIFVDETNVVGVQSRFIAVIRKSIPLDSITKIEVQDGQKKYRYADVTEKAAVIHY
jgi:hypothetical protein